MTDILPHIGQGWSSGKSEPVKTTPDDPGPVDNDPQSVSTVYPRNQAAAHGWLC